MGTPWDGGPLAGKRGYTDIPKKYPRDIRCFCWFLGAPIPSVFPAFPHEPSITGQNPPWQMKALDVPDPQCEAEEVVMDAKDEQWMCREQEGSSCLRP